MITPPAPPSTPRSPTAPRVGLALAAALAAVLVAGCVTERIDPPRGVRLRPRPAPTGAAAARVPMPDGPVASPASGADTLASRVTVAVAPLGTIPYDGLTLPLVSPDGRFIATQIGVAPDWPTLLAEPGAPVVDGSSIRVFRVEQDGDGDGEGGGGGGGGGGGRGRPQLAPADPVSPPPEGVLLGRSADRTGYLIEGPRADGTRWIGRINWLTGEVGRLVDDERANAHATLSPGGVLAWTRPVAGDPAGPRELVVRAPGGPDLTLRPPGESLLLPVFSDQDRQLLAFSHSPRGLDAVVVTILDDESGRPARLRVTRRRTILAGTRVDPAAAYQAVAGVQTPLAGAAGSFLFFHPGWGRMAVLDPENGRLSPLAADSFAATPAEGSRGEGGFFVGVPGELLFEGGADVRAAARGGRAVSVMRGDSVPVRVFGPAFSYLLWAPAGEREQFVMSVRAMTPWTGGADPEMGDSDAPQK